MGSHSVAEALLMITYEVRLNGKILTIAGGPDVCVLGVTLAAVGELGPDCEGASGCPRGVEMDLHVGGLRVPRDDGSHEPVHWVEESPLCVGDEITIRIKKSQTADHAPRPAGAPRAPGLADTARVGQDERAAFESARELYFRLRHKFPTDPRGN
jgi:hypothetical protein